MSSYRDDREAARARIETLEAKLREREAGLEARDAEIAELRAEIASLGHGPPAAPRPSGAGGIYAFVGVVAAIGAFAAALLLMRGSTRRSEAQILVAPAPVPVASDPLPPPVPTAPATAAAEEAQPDLSSTLFKELVPVRRAVRACYDRELTQRPGLSGKLLVTLMASGGRVTKINLAPSPLSSPAFDRCVAEAFKLLRVPQASEPTTVQIPFVFQAQ
jgi:hypothetical protein